MFSQQVFLQGLGMGASLIMPIGAQNAHVIRTGVRGRHVMLTAATCILVDIGLIALGMSGFGALVEASPRLLAACRWGGALFLLWYGGRCLLGAWRAPVQGGTVQGDGKAGGKMGGDPAAGGARQAFTVVLAMSLLNPHVYLDTVVVLGAVGSSLADGHRSAFALGAMLASLLWFSLLAVLARRFSCVLARPNVWRAVETVTGATMLILAALLLRGA